MNKKKVFSGIQSSGNVHLGNYLGAINKWVIDQDTKENIFCIVDLHAITVPQDPKELRTRIIETTKVLLAAGIDPQKSCLFVQSSRPEHSELGWIINCFTHMGELSRMTQFKDKSQKKQNISVGLFDYPALMAADILLYDTDEVPVGDDQKQHVELTRDIATRINNRYGSEVLHVPEFTTSKVATRIMSLTDPTKKMSKSDDNPKSRIELLDTPAVIRKKFAAAVTDSETAIKFNQAKKPGISNLLNILSVCTETSVKDLERKYQSVSYGEFKKDVAESVIALLTPLQEKYHQITDKEVRDILTDGAKAVAPTASKTLNRVKAAIGLGY